MIKYQGKTVLSGVAIGKLLLYRKENYQVMRIPIENTEEEISRFHEAKNIALQQLEELQNQAMEHSGKTTAAIFESHQILLKDSEYLGAIENVILTQQVNAEYAIACVSDKLTGFFSSMEDSYIKERAADVRDISERIITVLSKFNAQTLNTQEPVIILAEDLSPSETVQFDKSKVLSFVTKYGSINSHTAILARMMNIPAIIGAPLDLLQDFDGKVAIVDGFTGILYIDPDEETLERMQRKQTDDFEKRELLKNFKGKENITLDGKKISLYANIGGIEDIQAVLENDAGGIGLFRS